jgi:hypothetical protein
MVRYTVCFYCNREYAGEGKISRRDNKTEICGVCAEFEALRELFIQNIQQPTEAALETFYQLLSIRFGPLRA